MGKEADRRRIAGDPSKMLDDGSLVLAHCFGELGVAVETVHMAADLVAGGNILGCRRTDLVPCETHAERRAPHDGKRFARHKAETRIEGERAIVVGGLHQPDTGMIARPTRRFCAAGSTEIGPMPPIGERSSMKLLPTIWPSSSATNPWKPGWAISIEATSVATAISAHPCVNPPQIGLR